MAWLTFVFDSLSDVYLRHFGDFLHVHYLVRTVFLMLVVWFAIIVVLKLFKFIVGPSLLLFVYHVVFRFYNYLFVETPAEWIYITYYSKDLPRFEKAYFRLTSKAKRNRVTLLELDYGMAIRKAGKTEKRVSYFLLTVTTLWIMAFGLYFEFFPPPPAAVRENAAAVETPDEAIIGGADYNENGHPDGNGYEHELYVPGGISPAEWEGRVILLLNEEGQNGAWLRSGPGISGFVVTQVLWGDVRLVYENYFVEDGYVRGLYWLRVSTPDGNTGYISSSLVEVYG